MTDLQNKIIRILSNISPVPSSGMDEIIAKAETIHLSSGNLLISEGSNPDSIYLVVQGLLRAIYQTIEGNVCSKEFYWEEDIIFSMRSIIQDEPLPYSIFSVEDSTLIKIPMKLYLDLVKQHIEWKDYHIAQLNFYLHAKEVKEEMLLVNNNQEKVVKAYELFPDFVKRVPATLLASYLNLTPVSLSRIKKRLGLK